MLDVVYNKFDGLLNHITSHSKYNNPDFVKYMNAFFYSLTLPHDNFVIRMQAIFIAPYTGTIKFWLQGNDAAFLFIGDDATESSKKKIAEMSKVSNTALE